MPPKDHRKLKELLSDYFREASVLVLVFGFLDLVMKDHNFREGLLIGAAVFLVSVLLFHFGYRFELSRLKD
jgi:hypothetical protein